MPSKKAGQPGLRYTAALEALRAAILGGPGVLPPSTRAAAAGEDGPPGFDAFVDDIRRHAYRITDEQVAGLLASDKTEDEVFEVTVAAAYGAARRRLDAGLQALMGALERD